MQRRPRVEGGTGQPASREMANDGLAESADGSPALGIRSGSAGASFEPLDPRSEVGRVDPRVNGCPSAYPRAAFDGYPIRAGQRPALLGNQGTCDPRLQKLYLAMA